MPDQKTKEKKQNKKAEAGKISDCFLMLYNDDVNTFDFVIETLIDVCNHTGAQAEQCAYITHYKGKCDVKKGGREELKPYKEVLIEKGLKVKIL